VSTLLPRIFYTLDEAAAVCSVSKSTIEKAIREDRLRKTKIGKLARIHVNDLHAWARTLAGGPQVAESLSPENDRSQLIEKTVGTR
jgi:excisionase family DNA binding protein